MNMKLVLTERIQAFEGILEHLQENSPDRRRHYQEKCELYRRVLSDLTTKAALAEENRSH
jgi:hypothetical protein